MKNTTVIVLVVIGIIVIGLIMYQSSQTAQRDRDLQLQLAQMNTGTPEANVWSSINNLGSIIDTIGGLFGRKEEPIILTATAAPSPYALINQSDDTPYTSTEVAATNGLDYLVNQVGISGYN